MKKSKNGKKSMKKISYKVDFPVSIIGTLEETAFLLDSDIPTVLKEAVALYSYVNKEVAKRKGSCLYIACKHQVIQKIKLKESII